MIECPAIAPDRPIEAREVRSGNDRENEALEIELRLEAVNRLAGEIPDLEMPEHVLIYLSCRVRPDEEEIRNALQRVAALVRSGGALSIDDVEASIREVVTLPRRVTIDEIQGRVARYYRIPNSDMRSGRRAWEFAHPRQVAMYLSKLLTPRSLSEIGRKFRRDHTTVIHGIRAVEKRRTADGDLDRDIKVLETLLLN